MTAWICRLTKHHWLKDSCWFKTPHGWQRDWNCRFCPYYEHDMSIFKGWNNDCLDRGEKDNG